MQGVNVVISCGFGFSIHVLRHLWLGRVGGASEVHPLAVSDGFEGGACFFERLTLRVGSHRGCKVSMGTVGKCGKQARADGRGAFVSDGVVGKGIEVPVGLGRCLRSARFDGAKTRSPHTPDIPKTVFLEGYSG